MNYDHFLEDERAKKFDNYDEYTPLCKHCEVPILEDQKKYSYDDTGEMLFLNFDNCLPHIAQDLTEIVLKSILGDDDYLCTQCFMYFKNTYKWNC